MVNWKTLYDQEKVRCVIRSMASKILWAHTSSEQLVIIAILKGGCWTAYNLVNELSGVNDLRIGHLGISSYGNGRRPDQPKITSTLDLSLEDVRGADVWLVDDIYDTGATMQRAREIVQLMQPNQIRTATLVQRIGADSGPTISGFKYSGDQFLAGCGMGCGELYRHLNSIHIVPATGE